jgi:hypothetical protein
MLLDGLLMIKRAFDLIALILYKGSIFFKKLLVSVGILHEKNVENEDYVLLYRFDDLLHNLHHKRSDARKLLATKKSTAECSKKECHFNIQKKPSHSEPFPHPRDHLLLRQIWKMARVQHQSETFSVAILSKRFRNVR